VKTRVVLAPGRERSLLRGHPWVFSGAIASVEPSSARQAAGIAVVEAANGEALGEGFWNPGSQIAVRLAAGATERFDRELVARRLERAAALRRAVVDPQTTGYRWVNAEGDGLPAWTIDRFGEVLVTQVTCAGLEAVREEAYAALDAVAPGLAVRQSNDLPGRRLEGLTVVDEVVRGSPPEVVEFRERGLRFEAEIAGGQKTGFYLDQRDNRRRVEELAHGRRVLDLFAHTGAFGIAARRGGAAATVHVESSPAAIERGLRHYLLNELDATRVEWIKANAFDWLRRDELRASFDLVICDPPPLARRRTDVERAARAYKDLNRWALRALAPGGLLFTFSCSGAIDGKLFRQILHSAAQEAGVAAQLLAPLAAAPDHPVSIHHLEGEYLKGWLIAS
jgi:23S rRNA (cytosine1962-C5)-methyltransferase